MVSAKLQMLAVVAISVLGTLGCAERQSNALQVVFECKFTSSSGDIPLHVSVNLDGMEGRILSSDTGVSVRPIASPGELRLGTMLSNGEPHEVRIRPDGSATLLAIVDSGNHSREVDGKCSRT